MHSWATRMLHLILILWGFVGTMSAPLGSAGVYTLCEDQPVCLSLPPEDACKEGLIKKLCPVMCDTCPKDAKKAEKSLPSCEPECQNGGSCIIENVCECLTGYSGNFCEEAVCNLKCQNGGSCIAPEKCECLPGYSGDKCQYPVCKETCHNGGICMSPDTCACLPGFTGPLCQNVQICEDHPLCAAMKADDCTDVIVRGKCPKFCKLCESSHTHGHECNEDCSSEFDPVCGTNGVTYDNLCLLQLFACWNPELNLISEHKGQCRKNCAANCDPTLSPVCGTDGKTYENFCQLTLSACWSPNKNISRAYEGECKSEMSTGSLPYEEKQSQASIGNLTIEVKKSRTDSGSLPIEEKSSRLGTRTEEPGNTGCHEGYDKVGRQCITTNENSMSWVTAKANCNHRNTMMVEVRDPEIDRYLNNQACENPFDLVKGGCMWINSMKMTWKEAKTNCESKGATLFIPRGELQIVQLGAWIKEKRIKDAQADHYDDKSYWIGGEAKGRTWLNGDAITGGWKNGEPSGHGCVHIEILSTNIVNRVVIGDMPCTHSHYFVCLKDPKSYWLGASDTWIEGVCSEESSKVGNQCLYTSETRLTWSDAQQTCENMKGSLLRPQDDRKLLDYLSIKNWESVFWLGLSNTVEDRYYGPFDQIWDDSQCDDIGITSVKSVSECMSHCDAASGCTAINYKANPTNNCIKLACTLPVPEPKWDYSPYQGYAITDLCSTKGERCTQQQICASDGVTYNNGCLFKEAKCRNQNLKAVDCKAVSTPVATKPSEVSEPLSRSKRNDGIDAVPGLFTLAAASPPSEPCPQPACICEPGREPVITKGIDGCPKCKCDDSGVQTLIACEGHELNIECKLGQVINIIKASYGRTSLDICTNGVGITESALGCHSETSNQVLSDRCNGNRRCTMAANNAIFGDPCGGTHKYLEVDFICEQTGTSFDKPLGLNYGCMAVGPNGFTRMQCHDHNLFMCDLSQYFKDWRWVSGVKVPNEFRWSQQSDGTHGEQCMAYTNLGSYGGQNCRIEKSFLCEDKCPINNPKVGSQCLFISSERADWKSARQHCEDMSGEMLHPQGRQLLLDFYNTVLRQDACRDKIGSQCLILIDVPMTWTDARDHCKSRGTDLVSLSNPDELSTYVKENHDRELFWVGGTDSAKEGEWFWVNETPFKDDFPWAKDNPNGGDNENCLMVADQGFLDASCSHQYKFFCQSNLNYWMGASYEDTWMWNNGVPLEEPYILEMGTKTSDYCMTLGDHGFKSMRCNTQSFYVCDISKSYNRAIAEIDFKTIGGEAKASSIWTKHWEPSNAFTGKHPGWHNAKRTSLPQNLWYEFPIPVSIKRFSFKTRTDKRKGYERDEKQGYHNYGPTIYILWASNGPDCSEDSTWDILFEDRSDKAFDIDNTPKEEDVNNVKFYKCYGFKVIKSRRGPMTAISNVRMFLTSLGRPCFIDGISYPSGKIFNENCMKFKCHDGRLYSDFEYNIDCGVCSIHNDPHFTNFDGIKFDWHGHNTYYMVSEGCKKCPTSYISAKFTDCASGLPWATCVDTTHFKIENSLEVTIFKQESVTKTIVSFSGHNQTIAVTKNRGLQILEGPNGVKAPFIAWHAHNCLHIMGIHNGGLMLKYCGWSMKIFAYPYLQGNMCGMCGTWIGNDHLQLRNETKVQPPPKEGSWTEKRVDKRFGHHWLVSENCNEVVEHGSGSYTELCRCHPKNKCPDLESCNNGRAPCCNIDENNKMRCNCLGFSVKCDSNIDCPPETDYCCLPDDPCNLPEIKRNAIYKQCKTMYSTTTKINKMDEKTKIIIENCAADQCLALKATDGHKVAEAFMRFSRTQIQEEEEEAAATVVFEPPLCPRPYTLGNSYCYFSSMIQVKLTWKAAIKRCHDMGGMLAEPKDSTHFINFLNGILPKDFLGSLWLGGSNKQDAVWRWFSGDAIETGIIKTMGNGNCLRITISATRESTITDGSCEDVNSYICIYKEGRHVCPMGCQNGGKCISQFKCRCLKGWSGQSCEKDIRDKCANLLTESCVEGTICGSDGVEYEDSCTFAEAQCRNRNLKRVVCDQGSEICSGILVGSQCLLFISIPRNWHEAGLDCRSRGGRLAVATDHVRLMSHIKKYGDTQYWVGASRTLITGDSANDGCTSLQPPGTWEVFYGPGSPGCPPERPVTVEHATFRAGAICCQPKSDDCTSLQPPGEWVNVYQNFLGCPAGRKAVQEAYRVAEKTAVCCQPIGNNNDPCPVLRCGCTPGYKIIYYEDEQGCQLCRCGKWIWTTGAEVDLPWFPNEEDDTDCMLISVESGKTGFINEICSMDKGYICEIGPCDFMCTKEYRPICDSNDITHSNLCMLNKYYCNYKTVPTYTDGVCDCNKVCSKDINPVCDSSGKKYDNKCLFDIAWCKDNTLQLADCKVPCPVYVHCGCGTGYTLNRYIHTITGCEICDCLPCPVYDCFCENGERMTSIQGPDGCPQCFCKPCPQPLCRCREGFQVETFINPETNCPNCRCVCDDEDFCVTWYESENLSKGIFELLLASQPDLLVPLKAKFCNDEQKSSKCPELCNKCGDKQDCRKTCPKILNPVCADNGRTYPNMCELQNAKCDDSSLAEIDCDCDKPCTKEYMPVCGSNGVMYSNKCEFYIARCQDNSLYIVTCSIEYCPQVNCRCEHGFSPITYTDLQTGCPMCRCGCHKFCPEVINPVCASDGLTYENHCQFEKAKCKHKDLSIVLCRDIVDPCPVLLCGCSPGHKTIFFENEQGCELCRCEECPQMACDCSIGVPEIILDDDGCPKDCICKTCPVMACLCLEGFTQEQIFNVQTGCEECICACKDTDQCNDIGPYPMCGLEQVRKLCPKKCGVCSDCTRGCTGEEYRPVCCSDGITYPSRCEFDNAVCRKSDLFEIVCNCVKMCTKQYAPVCGSDGQTYGNECMFHNAWCRDNSLYMVKCKTDICVTMNCMCAAYGYTIQTYVDENDGCSKCHCVPCPVLRCGMNCPPEHRTIHTTDEQGCKSCKCELCPQPACVCDPGRVALITQGIDGCPKCKCEICPTPICKCKTGQDRITVQDLSTGCPLCECRCTKICTKEYFPVCGSDGRLYHNRCMFENALCEKDMIEVVCDCMKKCPDHYSPVCGSDGLTYDNDCFFLNAFCQDRTLYNIPCREDHCPVMMCVCPFFYTLVTYTVDGCERCRCERCAQIACDCPSDTTMITAPDLKTGCPGCDCQPCPTPMCICPEGQQVREIINPITGCPMCSCVCKDEFICMLYRGLELERFYCKDPIEQKRCPNLCNKCSNTGDICKTPPNAVCAQVVTCGSDGVTYSTSCSFKEAKCRNSELLEVPCKGGMDECTSLHPPGTWISVYKDSPGCPVGTKPVEMAFITGGMCCQPIPFNPDCLKICDETDSPICGSDGVKYSNKCLFNNAKCKNRFLTEVICLSSGCEDAPSCIQLKMYAETVCLDPLIRQTCPLLCHACMSGPTGPGCEDNSVCSTSLVHIDCSIDAIVALCPNSCNACDDIQGLDECTSLEPPGSWQPVYHDSPGCPPGTQPADTDKAGGLCCQPIGNAPGICSNGCHNGGTCIGSDHCVCTFGWTGTSCEISSITIDFNHTLVIENLIGDIGSLSEITWRTDLRCGPNFTLNGRPSTCDPYSEYPCCSPCGWCGNTKLHCLCRECNDYRKNANDNTMAIAIRALMGICRKGDTCDMTIETLFNVVEQQRQNIRDLEFNNFRKSQLVQELQQENQRTIENLDKLMGLKFACIPPFAHLGSSNECLLLSHTLKTWREAVEDCKSQDANLYIPDNIDETANYMILNTIGLAAGSQPFVGGSNAPNKPYTWVDGGAISSSNFHKTPDLKKASCVVFNPILPKKLEPVDCSQKRQFICKKEKIIKT